MNCPHCTRADCLPQAALGNMARYHEPLRVACRHCGGRLYLEEVRSLKISKSKTTHKEDDFGTKYRTPKAKDEADTIARLCEEAYSYDRWGHEGFRAVAQQMLDHEIPRRLIIGVLFSKHMRWAADNSDEPTGAMTIKTWDEYTDRAPLSIDQMEELCWEGMPT